MKAELENPFILKDYLSPVYFCDRANETETLIENARNGLNTTLISIRRMGKTGLIHHILQEYRSKKQGYSVYVDIYDTQQIGDFVTKLANALLQSVPQKHPFWKKAYAFIRQLRPVITFDELSGSPQITLDVSHPQQVESSLTALLQFLEKLDQPVLIAIDEFQQITQYPEKNTEALLRSIIQTLKNVHFIFSGSSPHMLATMFMSSKRPFFLSTQTIGLSPIPADLYADFIRKHFKGGNKAINDEAIEFILNFTRRHTFYTQLLCHRLYQLSGKQVTEEDAKHCALELLRLNEMIYFQYRTMLTANQWQLLRAVAKETEVSQPTAAAFVMRYQLGSASSVQRALKALLDTEMIYIDTATEPITYKVYDCFLSRWLERL